MTRLAVLAALLLLAGCGSHAAADPPAGSPRHRGEPAASTSVPPAIPARFTRDRCADVVVLGLRGQGQSARTHHGVGHEVELATRSLVRAMPDGSGVRLQTVRFPAVSAATEAEYDADIASGVHLVERATSELARACPTSRIALVGFSEGAQVAHVAASRHAFGLVLLMGDPLRNPRLSVRTLSFGTRLTGRGNAGYGPPFADAAHVIEACVAGDNVCNAPPTGRVGRVSATHRVFYERQSTARAVGRAAADQAQ